MHLDPPDISDTEEVAARFDVSPFRLWLLFQSVDVDRDGCVSKEELADCLITTEEMQASTQVLAPLQQLWDMLAESSETDTEKKIQGVISYPQFCRLIRYLWLQQLLNSQLDGSSDGWIFECIDYAGSYFDVKRVPGCTNDESRRFFTAPRHPQAKMRWINIPSGPASRITILRLGVKYRFHPTSVEDAIELEYQEPDIDSFENSLEDLGDFSMDSLMWLKHGMKTNPDEDKDGDGTESDVTAGVGPDIPPPVSSFRRSRSHIENDSLGSAFCSHYSVYDEAHITKGHGRHYFISVPMFELTQRSQRSLDTSLKMEKNMRPWVFAAVQSQSELPTIEVKEATLGIFVASKPNPNLVVTVSTEWRPTRVKPVGMRNAIIDQEPQEAYNSTITSLERVKRLLKKRHSIQRHGNSDWLLHAILDAVVDNLKPISSIYEAKIKMLSSRLLELGHRLSTREVKEIIVMKRDLEWLQHEMRPMLIVLRHLIADKNIGVEVTHYLEDIEDHLNLLIDELASYSRESEAMRDEFNSYSDRRMNDVLYLLTLVTTIFVPAQFFTGYFGMNFVDNDTGELGSPLLNQGWKGVLSFWAITLFTTGFVTLIMYHYKWFERPRDV